MRFLCLHGIGTGNAILEAQLYMVKRQLPGHEFVYFEGELETPPAPGVEMFFPGPYYSYFTVPSPSAVLDVVNRLEQFIDLHGPFDGIIGFSQGAALAASYLLHDANRPCPQTAFRCAVFFCAIQCWDLDSPGFTVDQEGHCRSIAGEGSPPDLVWTTDKLTSVFSSADHPLLCREWNADTPLLWPYGKAPRRLGPLAQISIPSLHIVGAKDPYRADSLALQTYCMTDKTQMVETAAGHEIPRDSILARKVAQFLHTAPRSV
ncbi:hypothetical protein AbraIFM66950_012173 [Aspergillus brasiliensis]|nr:hypothetical protein AbraIFM66950_012173 [Aspergillus brasiliensis]